ncbi:hypothetical protein B0H14DRAFT_2637100 [Mycena olivaceomarginata]|nr:hypothetical protein B0H14DRAFT_2637100 [Mycena olivaceomarginata]
MDIDKSILFGSNGDWDNVLREIAGACNSGKEGAAHFQLDNGHTGDDPVHSEYSHNGRNTPTGSAAHRTSHRFDSRSTTTGDLRFLLYRCYVIWGRQKKVLILPGGLIISTVDSPAGRIWMKRREAVYIGADSLKNRYNTAIAIIVESGALYCTFLILLAITRQSRMTWIVLSGALAHLMNIIPALIIVRASLGHNIQDKIESQPSRTTPSRGGEWQKPSFEVLDLKPPAGKCIETV